MPKHPLYLISLKNHPIHDQLLLEEALLRSTCDNYCILNEGSPDSIVMGISGKPHLLINPKKMEEKKLPVIKRFSGGGTVIVDSNTLFVSFIFEKNIHDFPCYPEPILKWSEGLYKEVLDLSSFHLKENDYVIGEKKCGGNAQYIQKNRFVHHTTFLWDFHDHQMEYLTYPNKVPNYRQGRSHAEFLCRLKDFIPSSSHFFSSIKESLMKRYDLKELPFESAKHLLTASHRKATLLM